MTTSETSPPVDHRDLTELATAVALEAGARVLALAGTARRRPASKSTSTDLVTEADRAAEELISRGLLAARPDDGILGEEGVQHQGTSAVVWHIDPIDGTTNYVYAIPAFSVSIAAEIDGRTVAGVVLNPSTSELYAATSGEGATCNGEPLQTRPPTALATALVATGFGYRPELRRRQAELLVELLPEIRDIRRFGSAALDLCAVAAGQVDAYYEQGLNRWDLAAGALIASEAGAVVANLRDGPPDASFVLAAVPELFGPLRARLSDLGADSAV